MTAEEQIEARLIRMGAVSAKVTAGRTIRAEWGSRTAADAALHLFQTEAGIDGRLTQTPQGVHVTTWEVRK